jgi:hypothetical protein
VQEEDSAHSKRAGDETRSLTLKERETLKEDFGDLYALLGENPILYMKNGKIYHYQKGVEPKNHDVVGDVKVLVTGLSTSLIFKLTEKTTESEPEPVVLEALSLAALTDALIDSDKEHPCSIDDLYAKANDEKANPAYFMDNAESLFMQSEGLMFHIIYDPNIKGVYAEEVSGDTKTDMEENAFRFNDASFFSKLAYLDENLETKLKYASEKDTFELSEEQVRNLLDDKKFELYCFVDERDLIATRHFLLVNVGNAEGKDTILSAKDIAYNEKREPVIAFRGVEEKNKDYTYFKDTIRTRESIKPHQIKTFMAGILQMAKMKKEEPYHST